ncbi:hypothetical protein F2Q65_12350 [Thiohalocapsa marina]|uniref:Uncharacterized protein n=1 Tax=Thiohalocapsa marina TaxID=424902 RepID=A0A5M8FPK5_9GAMM|nr:hypothetical protein [Thiohalocapsa marina]KAA6184365.1 hypothetical protein F2Q65_12350 [Thiohalocapsa marina]
MTDLHLLRTTAAWGTPGFEAALKADIEQLDIHALPLQAGLTAGSRVGDQGFQVMVLRTAADTDLIRARIGVFFTGVEAGSCCADDPSPPDARPQYCQLQVAIDRHTAEARLTLLPDPESELDPASDPASESEAN